MLLVALIKFIELVLIPLYMAFFLARLLEFQQVKRQFISAFLSKTYMKGTSEMFAGTGFEFVGLFSGTANYFSTAGHAKAAELLINAQTSTFPIPFTACTTTPTVLPAGSIHKFLTEIEAGLKCDWKVIIFSHTIVRKFRK